MKWKAWITLSIKNFGFIICKKSTWFQMKKTIEFQNNLIENLRDRINQMYYGQN